MAASWKGLLPMGGQRLAPLIDGRVRDAQLLGHLRDWLAARLRQSHRFALKLSGVRLLHFLHALHPLSEVVYLKGFPPPRIQGKVKPFEQLAPEIYEGLEAEIEDIDRFLGVEVRLEVITSA